MRHEAHRPLQDFFPAKNWKFLKGFVDEFLQLDEVQYALMDNHYRNDGFTREWESAPKDLPFEQIRSMYDYKKIRSWKDCAFALWVVAKDTQKEISRDSTRKFDGMREMTEIQEWMNLLLHGETLRGTYEVLDVVVPEKETIDDLRIHTAVTVEIVVRGTQGNLKPDLSDIPVVKSHCIFLIVSHTNQRIQYQIAPINLQGTGEEIWRGYAYGLDRLKRNDPEGWERKVKNRIQGARYRGMQAAQTAFAHLAQLRENKLWKGPGGSHTTTVLLSEVCSEKAVARMDPTFFEDQWGMGLCAPEGETIKLGKENNAPQILAALRHLTTTVLHYPTDNAAIPSETFTREIEEIVSALATEGNDEAATLEKDNVQERLSRLETLLTPEYMPAAMDLLGRQTKQFLIGCLENTRDFSNVRKALLRSDDSLDISTNYIV